MVFAEAQKVISNTASFQTARDVNGASYSSYEYVITSHSIDTYSYYGHCPLDQVGLAPHWGDIDPYMPGLDDHHDSLHYVFRALGATKRPTPTLQARLLKKRKEASATQLREHREQFAAAKKAEVQSWLDHEVFEIIDLRKHKPKNFVTGR